MGFYRNVEDHWHLFHQVFENMMLMSYCCLTVYAKSITTVNSWLKQEARGWGQWCIWWRSRWCSWSLSQNFRCSLRSSINRNLLLRQPFPHKSYSWWCVVLSTCNTPSHYTFEDDDNLCVNNWEVAASRILSLLRMYFIASCDGCGHLVIDPEIPLFQLSDNKNSQWKRVKLVRRIIKSPTSILESSMFHSWSSDFAGRHSEVILPYNTQYENSTTLKVRHYSDWRLLSRYSQRCHQQEDCIEEMLSRKNLEINWWLCPSSLVSLVSSEKQLTETWRGIESKPVKKTLLNNSQVRERKASTAQNRETESHRLL